MRITNTILCTTLISMLMFVGCEAEHPEPTLSDERQAIETVIEQLTDAYVARDWDAFASFFADDSVWMPPGIGPLRGKDAWWSFVQPWWDDSTVLEIGSTTEELVVIDDWAIEFHSEYQVMTFEDGAEPASLYFKGVWIFRRQEDGIWRITQYIWDEDVPPD